MKRFVLPGLILSLAAGCGDNIKPGGNDPVDAPPTPIDAPDAPTDGPPESNIAVTITALEAEILGFGQGYQIGVTFLDTTTVPAPIMDTAPTGPFGCKAWQYNTAQTIASFGEDQGPVTLTFGDGSPGEATCIFVPQSAGNPLPGYQCPVDGSASAGGVIASAGMPGLFTFTDADANFTADDIGRYIAIRGAATAGNNGAFPIVNRVAATTIVFASSSAAAEDLSLTAGANHVTVAGVGPIPFPASNDPGLLEDDDTIVIHHAASADVPEFEATVDSGNPNPGIANDFTLGTADGKVLPGAIPTNGAAFTIGCDDDAACGKSASDSGAFGSLVNIVTTDAPTTGLSPFVVPPPTTRRIQIRCTEVGQTKVNIPAEFSALIQSAGATRIQTTFIRGNLGSLVPNTIQGVNVLGGHAKVGFQNP